MPELKNNFLKSKMNKDLDERLVPNGEYRNALGVNIRQSEGQNVGALEVVQGNELKWSLNPNMRFVGRFDDEINNTIYFFTTDHTGQSRADSSTEHKIIKTVAGGAPITLVEGYFLNFSQDNIMTGISLLENLLFFTDNRNQPRVIDVTQSLGYHTKEEHISVAKFSPYKPISVLFEQEKEVVSFSGPSSITLNNTTNIKKGDIVYNVTQDAEYGHVIVTPAGASITVDKDLTDVLPPGYNNPSSIKIPANGDVLRFLRSTMSDESADPNWPGDPDFLEDKFVRFSYRFQYENNEYSLVAPWTQPIFIPDQDGFFIENIYDGVGPAPGGILSNPDNENNAYKSTILNFFKNRVNNAVLYVPFPSNQPITDYKIKSLEILYKESDAVVQKIVEVIDVNSISFSSYKPQENYYEYTYQSKKPYRALPESVTTRVADKVPVKALSQEIISNRVVYGNFADRYDPPSISYTTQSGPRSPEFGNDVGEYPNHTLKQNRNYSVGVVLYDKYGRASTVILSDIVPAPGEKISTLYHPYKDADDVGYVGDGIYRVYDWNGDALRINFQQPITEAPSSNYPGTYAQSTTFNLTTTLSITNAGTGYGIASDVPTTGGSGTGMLVDINAVGGGGDITDLSIANAVTGYQTGDTITITGGSGTATADLTVNNTTITTTAPYTYTITDGDFTAQMPVDSYLRGYHVDYTKIISSTFTGGNTVIITEEQIADIYEYTGGYIGIVPQEPKQSYVINPEGWYSYRVVVQQTEQDYYNVFLPGLTNGFPYNTAYLSVTNGGFGYSLATDVGTNTIAGTGSGMTVDILEVDINGRIVKLKINQPGSLYVSGTSRIEVFDPSTGAPPASPCTALIKDVPNTSAAQQNKLATTPLISDNINKVPRDLSEVGPDQKQYRSSSVKLYLRVNNTPVQPAVLGDNVLFFPGRIDHYAAQIGAEQDLLDATNAGFVTSIPFLGYYGGDGNPLIAVIDTDNQGVGVTYQAWDAGQVASPPYDILPRLAVYETEPVESLLDIYWETSTTGLISDLNELISTTFTGVISLSPVSVDFREDVYYTASPTAITSKFTALDATGGNASGVIAKISQVVDTNGTGTTIQTDLTPLADRTFTLNQTPGPPFDEFEIICNKDFTYISTSGGPTGVDIYVITIETTLGGNTTYHDITVDLTNLPPAAPVATAPVNASGYIEVFDFDTFVTDVTSLTNGSNPSSTRIDGLLFDIINEQKISGGSPTSTNIFTVDPVVLGGSGFGESAVNVDATQTTAGEIYQMELRSRDASSGFGSLTATTTITVEIKTGPILRASSGCVDDLDSGWSCPTPSRVYVPKGGFQQTNGMCNNPSTGFPIPGDFTCEKSFNSGLNVSSLDSSWTVSNINNILTDLSAFGGIQSNAFVFAMEVVTPNPAWILNDGNEYQFEPLANRPAGRDDEILHVFRNGGSCATGSPISIATDWNPSTLTGDPKLAYGTFSLSGGSTSKVINHGIENIYRESWKNCSDDDTIIGTCTGSSGQRFIGTIYIRIKIKAYDPTGVVFGSTTSPGSGTGWTYYDNNQVICERVLSWVVSDMEPYWTGITCEVGLNDPRVAKTFTCSTGTPSYPGCNSSGSVGSFTICCP